MRFALALGTLLLCIAPGAWAEVEPNGTTPQPRTLSSGEFDRYLKALDAVMSVRARAETTFRADPKKGRDTEAQAAYASEAKDAMESHGFSPEDFNLVHWNVMQAYAQIEIQANVEAVESTLEEERKKLAELKDSLPEEVYERSMKRLESTRAILEGSNGAPSENVELVRANMDHLRNTFEQALGGPAPPPQAEAD